MDLPLDLESPHDLAKQALAATGGKSTVKATEWILNKRAHSSSIPRKKQQQQQQQQQPPQSQHHFHHHQVQFPPSADALRHKSPQKGRLGGAGITDTVEGETSQRKGLPFPAANAGGEGKTEAGLRKPSPTRKGREDAANLFLIPSPPLRNNVGQVEKSVFGSSVVPPPPPAEKAGAVVGQLNGFERFKPPSLRSAMDWVGSNSIETPISIDSNSLLDRPSENDDQQQQFPLNVLKPIRISEPGETTAHKPSRSPERAKGKLVAETLKPNRVLEPGENARPSNVKAVRLFPVAQEVSCKRQRQEDPETNGEPLAAPPPAQQQGTSPRKPVVAPLAERMQPSSIDEILGQDHLLGPQCIIRSLHDSENVPCMILWGPPGTGKTSLARLLSRCASCRFIPLPCTESAAGTELQDILEEAKQAKKHGMRTLVFVKTLQRFSKAQQEAVLSAIDAGHVVFIGVTTYNPSNELTSALLSKCRVFTLKKLQPDHLLQVMERAILDKCRGVLASLSAVSGVESVAVEVNALQFLAGALDGNARLVLDVLEAAVTIAAVKDKTSKRPERDANGFVDKEITVCISTEKERSTMSGPSARRVLTHDVLEHLKANFQFCQEEYVKPFKKFVGGREATNQSTSKDREGPKILLDTDKGGFVVVGKDAAAMDVLDGKAMSGDSARENPTTVVVTLAEMKEALQWLIESGKDNHGLLVAMLKSMRGGNGNAAIYWLARVLESGENPLNVAQQLIVFASEDVGLADANALVQAVASYQACQLLGMPDCSLSLAQCVAYLSMAPKSAAVKHAIVAAQQAVRYGGQGNEPVPLHMRTASGSNLKELGYLPSSLNGRVFLHWPESQILSSESLDMKEDR